ncbi:hypothetical protein [Mycolicibacterium setense]
MDVRTDHQIVAFGTEHMKLFDSTTGDSIVTATRSAGTWTITADGVPDVTAPDRPAAIAAMTEQALAALGASGPGGRGYSTVVPYGLPEQP